MQAWCEAAVDPLDPGPEVELMRRALLVSEPGDQALLLDPDEVDPVSGEWACYSLSNVAPGSHRVGDTFRSGLEDIYRDFLAAHLVQSATIATAEQTVEEVYQGLLAGDLNGRDRLEVLVRVSWRAWLLAAQFDVFGARPYESRDKSGAVQHLWWGGLGGVSTERALSDLVLVDDLLPLWVVRLIETGLNVEWELHRAPSPVAQQMRVLLAAIADGTGPVADFSYSPAFAARADIAREQVSAGELDAGWHTIHSALPLWTPMSGNHLAPLGLYYDKDLRQLLTPPRLPAAARPTGPAPGSGRASVVSTATRQASQPTSTASVIRLAQRKLHSERTLAILRTPYQEAE